MRQIREAITGQPRQPGRRRPWWPGRPQRRHRRAIITCVAVPVLLGATAAGWAIAVSPPASYVTNEVLCYSGPYDRGPMLDHSNGVLSTVSDGTPPSQVCARQWATGAVLGDPHSHLIPPLVACVLPPGLHPGAAGNNGSVGVFPDTTCAKLNLAALPPGYDQAARRLFALDSHLRAGAPALHEPRRHRPVRPGGTAQVRLLDLAHYPSPGHWLRRAGAHRLLGGAAGQLSTRHPGFRRAGFAPRKDVGPESVIRNTLCVAG